MLSAALIVCATVAGTLAWLTDKTEPVVNTFTVGDINIELKETTGKTYKMVPGIELVKDPTVTVKAGSEACWLFVKVENGISAIEADTKIAAQIAANGWTALDGVADVYYKPVNANANDTAVDYPVFGTFTLTDTANVSAYEDATIKVTAYAIQKDGFTTPAAAWAEVGK